MAMNAVTSTTGKCRPARSPKILWASERFHPDIGGVETRALAVISSLTRKGFDVQVLVLRADGVSGREVIKSGVLVRSVGCPESKWPPCIRPILVLTRWIRELMFYPNADVVITPSQYAVIAAKVLGYGHKVVYCPGQLDDIRMRNLLDLGGFLHPLGMQHHALILQRRLALAIAVKIADRVTVESRQEATKLYGHMPIASNRLCIHPSGVDVDRFSVPRGVHKDVRVGIFCRMVDVKNVDMFLKALAVIEHGVRGFVVGSGLELERLKKFARELGCQQRVCFVGATQYPERIYATLDAVVVCSHSESFGFTALEAMAAGAVPIIRRPDPPLVTIGVAEYLRDGYDSLFFETYSVEDLAQKILLLGKRPAYREELRRHAAERVRTDFQWDAVVTRVFEGII